MKDKKIQKFIVAERHRQKKAINLIASENYVSDDVLMALGSELTNKYSEGYPGKRYYPGNKIYDEIEKLTQSRALKLFKLKANEWSANVQSYSGSPANFAIYSALIGHACSPKLRKRKQGTDIMGLSLSSGGHLTHGHHVSLTGKFWNIAQYTTKKNGWIDYDAAESLARKVRPKVIVSGFTAYPQRVDFKRFGAIAKKVGAYHVADISHIAGLVAGREHLAPFPYADVVMTTTHKTLRGPRGAIIFSRNELAEKINKAVFPGLQGGPHNNVTAAKAVALYEAMQPSFKKYAKQIVKNAKVLADELTKLGFVLVTGGTDTHLILIDLKNFGISGADAEKRLEAHNIITNRNTVPGDTSPFKPSGLRLGTAATTTRGMKEKDMRAIARDIHAILTSGK